MHLSYIAHLVFALAWYLVVAVVGSVEELIGGGHCTGSDHVLTADIRAIGLLVGEFGSIENGSILLRVFAQYRRLMVRS